MPDASADKSPRCLVTTNMQISSVGDMSATRRRHVADLILLHQVFVESVLGHLDKVSMIVKTVSAVSATGRRRC